MQRLALQRKSNRCSGQGCQGLKLFSTSMHAWHTLDPGQSHYKSSTNLEILGNSETICLSKLAHTLSTCNTPGIMKFMRKRKFGRVEKFFMNGWVLKGNSRVPRLNVCSKHVRDQVSSFQVKALDATSGWLPIKSKRKTMYENKQGTKVKGNKVLSNHVWKG